MECGGFTISDKADAIDAVIASFDRTFDYWKLQVAFDAIRAGARFSPPMQIAIVRSRVVGNRMRRR